MVPLESTIGIIFDVKMMAGKVFLVILFATVGCRAMKLSDNDKMDLVQKLRNFQPQFKQPFNANECQSLDDNSEDNDVVLLGARAYMTWAEKQTDNPKIQGCACEEVTKIAKVVQRTSRLSYGELDWVWRAFCEGEEDPITDNQKFDALLSELGKYSTEHIFDLLRYGEEIVRGYLKDLPLTDTNWGIAFVMNEIVNRSEDESLVTSMEFCYKLNLDKSVYTKIADDRGNNRSEQGFYRYFMDYARDDYNVVTYLKTDPNLIPEVIDNLAALFRNESRANEEVFKSKCIELGKRFIARALLNSWDLMTSNAVSKAFANENFNPDRALDTLDNPGLIVAIMQSHDIRR